VDRTSVLANGSSFGEPNLQNLNFNWGSTTTGVYVANASTMTAPGLNTGAADFPGRFAQIYAHNASGAPTISYYWNSGSNLPRDLGTTGTATGLPQPLIGTFTLKVG
jgi:beta-galactosidase GanA